MVGGPAAALEQLPKRHKMKFYMIAELWQLFVPISASVRLPYTTTTTTTTYKFE